MEPRGCNWRQPVADRTVLKSAGGKKQTETVAVGCDGKEGVDGSSPSEGFAVQPAISALLLSALTLV